MRDGLTDEPPPFAPREALALLGVSAALAAAVTFAPTGGEGTFVKTLRPTLHVLAWVAPAWVLLEKRKRDPLVALALSARPGRIGESLLALLLLPLYAVGFWLIARRGQMPAGAPPSGEVAWAFVSNLAFAAMPEEAFFRGAFQPSILRSNRWAAIVVTSLVFALAHLAFDPLGEGPVRALVFFPSLVFGLMRERTGSVVPGAIFHALCNAVNLAVRVTPVR